MNFRTYLTNLINAKRAKADELRKLIREAQTADECRSLGDTLQAVLEELQAAQEQLDALEDDDNGGEQGQQASNDDNGGEERGANPLHGFMQTRGQYQTQRETGTGADSVEYRTAFMNFVCRGVAIPMELREEGVTVTADAGAVIPSTILQEIVKNMGAYGEIYERVRKLNVQGGVKIPILSVKPVANWIGEDAASKDQKITAKDAVVFSYFGLECKVAQSLLVNVTTLEVFQREFATLAAEAMVQALEKAIFTGSGDGQPMGILNDTRVPTANKITMTAEEFASWESWKKKVFAKMKKAYRTGSFIMEQGTFDGHIDGMVDQNGQPIGRVNYGITDGEAYRFGGKEVLTVENDIIENYETAEAGAVVAVFVNLKDYAINSNMQMTVVKWTDNDNNQIKNKAILVCDGKLVDPNGVLLIKKG